MHPVTHARLTTAVAVLVAGMGGGHLLMPHGAAGSPLRGASFYALVLLVGAWRGWREGQVAREEGIPSRLRPGARAAAYAVGALLLSVVGYVVMHGA